MVPYRDLLNRFDQEIKHINMHMKRLAIIRKDLFDLIGSSDSRKVSQETLKMKGLTRVYKCNIKDCMFLVQDDADLKRHFAKSHVNEETPSIGVLDSHVIATQVANALVKWFARQKEVRSQTEKEEEPLPDKTEPAKGKSPNSEDDEMTE
uniref:C2H2-type domain-containing protein n=1 Tax=Tetranychus urticae TaxID=32264 RepID=T1JZK4_TETUR